MSLSGLCFTQCLNITNSSLQLDCLRICGVTSSRNHPDGVPIFPDDNPVQSTAGCMTRVITITQSGVRQDDEMNSHHCPESCQSKYEEARATFGYNHWYACDHIAQMDLGYDLENQEPDCSTCSPRGFRLDFNYIPGLIIIHSTELDGCDQVDCVPGPSVSWWNNCASAI